MDVTSGSTINGPLVDLYDCNGTGAQVWQPHSNSSLVNPQSGRCLDDSGFGGSGTDVEIWDSNGGPNQQWTLP
jgi:beta-glucosidase